MNSETINKLPGMESPSLSSPPIHRPTWKPLPFKAVAGCQVPQLLEIWKRYGLALEQKFHQQRLSRGWVGVGWQLGLHIMSPQNLHFFEVLHSNLWLKKTSSPKLFFWGGWKLEDSGKLMEDFCGKFDLIHIDRMSTAAVCGSFGSRNSDPERNEITKSKSQVNHSPTPSNRKDTLSLWADWT